MFPLMYCASISGHVEAGDSPVNTVIKESIEETGITIRAEELEKFAIIRGKFDSELVKEYEFIHMFFVKKDIDLSKVEFSPDEVDSFKYITSQELRDLLNNKDSSLVPAWESYEALLSFLKYNSQ